MQDKAHTTSMLSKILHYKSNKLSAEQDSFGNHLILIKKGYIKVYI